MTKFTGWPDDAIDILVGGTPCQSFSVAGLRAGLADPRGNLMLTYLAIAARYRPRWLVWENVPGVLSSGDGRDFGTFLQGLGELGYGFAYRVLDAQYVRVGGFLRAVPQRRRRVFVVGYLGDWRRAAAVFFDGASLRGDSAPRREAGEGIAPTISARPSGGGGLGTDFDLDGGLLAYGGGNTKGPIPVAAALAAHGRRQDFEVETFVAHALRAEGFDASEDGTGREGRPSCRWWLPPLPEAQRAGDPMHPLAAGQHAPAIAYGIRSDAQRDGEAKTLSPDADGRLRLRPPGLGITEGISPTVDSSQPHAVAHGWAVRRLTPTECERLQGFPDGYTAIPRAKAKPAADGPRYKALGNSMAVNAMRWIGERIAMVDAIEAVREEAA